MRLTRLTFKTNEASVSSRGTLWVAGKATVRGMVESLIRSQERERQQRIADLESFIGMAECLQGSRVEPGLLRQLQLDRSSLHSACI